MNSILSVIIVHYRVPQQLFSCLESLSASKSKIPFEIIVIENDKKSAIEKDLKKHFPKLRYVINSKNVGFGAANNQAADLAKGEFLLFLNPDTKVFPKALDSMIQFLKKKRDAGIVSPLLLDQQGKAYAQGTLELTPIRAIFSLSFLYKLFPNNSFAKKYLLKDWDRNSVKEVDVAPGTAFMIRKELFMKLGGFDERFFLYFEEFDLCKRVRASGKKIFIIPDAKVSHIWGASTKQRNDINEIFQQSRYYYLKKHFGLIKALFVESFLRFDKYVAALTGSLLIALSLSLYRLGEFMHFIGDQAWFYVSARDMILDKTIPLVGITTSHTWLHQGALWTYMLAPFLALSQFNPFSGAVLTVGLLLLTIILIYKFGSEMFPRNVGIIAALLYATSPLIIMYTRMPYHTSPIPLFSLLFLYSLYRFIKGNPLFFPLSIFLLAILYNLEIATFLLTVVLVTVLVIGFWKKQQWFVAILNKKILSLSLLAFIIPMLPMLIYDFSHGFSQTLKVLLWIGYKIAVVFGYPSLHPESNAASLQTVLQFLGVNYQKLIYLSGSVVAFTIGLLSIGYLTANMFTQVKLKKYRIEILLVGLYFYVSVAGIIVTKTVSDAYLPVLFPIAILIAAVFFDFLLQRRPNSKVFLWLTIVLILGSNIYAGLASNYFATKGYSFKDRVFAAKQIVSEAEGRRYNLIGKGNDSQFESFTDTYEYLTWWLGNGPSDQKEKLQFIITEDAKGISIKQK